MPFLRLMCSAWKKGIRNVLALPQKYYKSILDANFTSWFAADDVVPSKFSSKCNLASMQPWQRALFLQGDAQARLHSIAWLLKTEEGFCQWRAVQGNCSRSQKAAQGLFNVMKALLPSSIFSRGVKKEVDAGRAHRILYEKLEKSRRGTFFKCNSANAFHE